MKTKIIGIYKITSPSGKIYIGQSVDIEKRFSDYKILKCKRQTKLYASFLKHGVNNHLFEIIEKCEHDELDDRERFYINTENSFNNKGGMNLKSGGAHGLHSTETKLKIGLKHRGKVISEKTKAKMSSGQKRISEWKSKNASRWQFGRKLSDAHKLNISIAHKGNKYAIGNKHTQETKNKISKTHTGNKYNVGLKRSIKWREMISNLHKGKPKTKEQRLKMSIARKEWHKKNKANLLERKHQLLT